MGHLRRAHLAALLGLLACGPGAADASPTPEAAPLSLFEPVPEAAPRAPLQALPTSLARQRDHWIQLVVEPARPGGALPPSVNVGFSNVPAPLLHLSWTDRHAEGGPARREVERGLTFLPTASSQPAPGDDSFYLAGWDPAEDRVLVQLCQVDVAAWADVAGGPDPAGPPVRHRTLWRSEPGGGRLVRALAPHPAAGRLVLLSADDCPALYALDLSGGAPLRLDLDCDDEPFLSGVDTLAGGLLSGPATVAGSFALVGRRGGPRFHRHQLQVTCSVDSCDADSWSCGAGLLWPHGVLLLFDEGADGRFERVRSYGGETFDALALDFGDRSP